MSVAVLGAGAFGTALAISLSGAGPVTLWARSRDHAATMARERRNQRRLPDIDIPRAVRITSDLAVATEAGILLLAVPAQRLRGFLDSQANRMDGKQLVACSKGLETGSGLGPVGVIAQAAPGATGSILTGPSFAHDIARGLPTALTLACTDEAAAVALQARLSTGALRLYRTNDVPGAEIGGALKNVMAIGCGVVMGAGLGESARAALMTRGYAELVRVAVSRGARPETLAGLSGLGDLALTCTSDKSRNYRFGMALGRGEPFDPDVTVEGAATARAMAESAAAQGLDLPITGAIVSLLEGRVSVGEAARNLLSRPLKEE